MWTAATNDLGVASGEFFVDAEFLSQLPSYGAKAVAELVLPLQNERRLLGRVEMNIVGVLRDVPLSVFFDAADEADAEQAEQQQKRRDARKRARRHRERLSGDGGAADGEAVAVEQAEHQHSAGHRERARPLPRRGEAGEGLAERTYAA